jgi:hypothetical protein
VSYRGAIRNDDYKLSVTIPQGLTGWGADSVAPFHGFTIFLSSEGGQSSCLMLEIHLRVDPDDRAGVGHGARIAIGSVTGWKREANGMINGAE